VTLADRLRPVRRIVGRVEAAQVRRFGRSGTSLVWRVPVLVVETTGRRTGRRRSTPLAFVDLGDGTLLLAGGAGGQTATPDWVANLRAEPSCQVVLRRRRSPMTATELEGTARDDAWRRVVAATPNVERYAERSGRHVPLFLLRPTT
jgi:F420H(2)-dependent quinone reductase